MGLKDIEWQYSLFWKETMDRKLLLTSRQNHPENSVIKVGNVLFGNGEVVIIGGPCSVENEASILDIAKKNKI